MLNLNVSLSSLLGSIVPSTPKDKTPGAEDGFASLLAIGIDSDDDMGAVAKDQPSADNNPDPVAAAIDVATPPLPEQSAIRAKDVSRRDNDATDTGDTRGRENFTANSAGRSARDEQSPNQDRDNNTDNKVSAPPPAVLRPAVKSSSDNATEAANDAASATPVLQARPGYIQPQTDSQGDDAASSDDVAANLQAQLLVISQILQSMIQTLSAKQPDHEQSVATTADAQDNATQLTLLKDIQSLLQKMQAALQPVADTAQTTVDSATPADSAAPAPLPVATATDLEQLNALLQDDLAQLTALLPAKKETSVGTPVMSASPVAGQPLPDMSVHDLAVRLKSGIARVRDQLQQLKQDNETVFAQAQSTLHKTSPDIAELFKNMLDNAPAAKEAMVVQAAVTADVASPVAAQQPVTVTLSQTAAMVTAVQAEMNNSGGDTNSGGNQQQGQAPAQGIAATSSSAASSHASLVANGSFAKVLTQASPPNVMQQVEFQIKTSIADGSSKIHIHLDPEELGKVEIKLTVGADGKTGVTVIADNKDTLALLQRDAQSLARTLSDAGLNTDSGSLNFNLRGGQQEQNGQNSQASNIYQKSQPDDESEIALNVITRSYTVNLNEGLDIRI